MSRKLKCQNCGTKNRAGSLCECGGQPLLLKSIFDYNNIDDLPGEVKEQLNKKAFAKDRIIRLLRKSKPFKPEGVLLDELLVAYYREYGEVMKRRPMQEHLNRLKNINRITKHRRRFIYNGDEE